MWENSERDYGWDSESVVDDVKFMLYDKKATYGIADWINREKFAQSLTNACGWTWEIWARDYALSSIEDSLIDKVKESDES